MMRVCLANEPNISFSATVDALVPSDTDRVTLTVAQLAILARVNESMLRAVQREAPRR